jgi:SAM-dependent methyltransferase
MPRGSGQDPAAALSSTGACPLCAGRRIERFANVQQRDYWRCSVCALRYLDPAQRPDAETQRAEYLLHRNTPVDTGYRRFLSRLTGPLLERLHPGCEGLDYGCGPGPALAAMLGEAGHRLALYDPFFRDDTAALTRRYDFVTCTEVVEHFHDPAGEFAPLDGLLRPGGWLAVMTCFQTDDARFAGWHYRRDPTHVAFYRAETFDWLARRHDWRCEIPVKDVALLHKPL